jgi:hypothetical protein
LSLYLDDRVLAMGAGCRGIVTTGTLAGSGVAVGTGIAVAASLGGVALAALRSGIMVVIVAVAGTGSVA